MQRPTGFHFVIGSCLLFGLALVALIATGMLAAPPQDPGEAAGAPKFVSARPVWPVGREQEMNLSVGFRAAFRAPEGGRPILRATGSSVYRVYLNGEFLGYGPARGPHGFYRVDEWDLTGRLRPGMNLVAFEVAGYNVNSYYLLDQPSFLQAEVLVGDTVLASTGGGGIPFSAIVLDGRLQKVERYSSQRTFSEVYRLNPGFDDWRRNPSFSGNFVETGVLAARELLARRVAFPDYVVRQPSWMVSKGTLETGVKVEKIRKERYLTGIGPRLKGFPEAELVTIPSIELQQVRNLDIQPIGQPYDPSERIDLQRGRFSIVDFGVNLTGFVGASFECSSKCRVFLTFDEVLSGDEVDYQRLGCVNVVEYDLEPGKYEVETFEPYTMRYLKMMVLGGECRVGDIHLRELADSSSKGAQFAAADQRFNRLFAAGRETFRQNSVDIFMDCPSRERAGWLCDSFFTSRTAFDLSGETRIERNFLENFLLPKSFAHLPEGMLPMCYPADHFSGTFIPNWSLWFVVELEEYLERSGDRELVDALKPKVLKLFEYFKKFRNQDGLLEKLESWVFIEWSKANDFVQDVNYPSNMLYSAALAAAGRMYELPEFGRESQRVREAIRKQSYNGTFFVDNALRKDERLVVTENVTEVCQYFAFFFGVADPGTYPELWDRLIKDFGPQRKATGKFPEVYPANAFVGNVLRLELLSRYGLSRQLLDESLAYQLYMADRTGTLWENDTDEASCNHGFASHGGVHLLYRDVLGLQRVDVVRKSVDLRFTDLDLGWCEGSMPTPEGPVELRWSRDRQNLKYRVAVPAGYQVRVTNQSKLTLERMP